MAELYMVNGKSGTRALEKWRELYGRENEPAVSSFAKQYKKFEQGFGMEDRHIYAHKVCFTKGLIFHLFNNCILLSRILKVNHS